MEHNQAQQNEAVERYLLNEMSEAEADAFESHFFDCPVCAEDVRAGSRMMMAGQAVSREERTKVVPLRRPPFLTYLATAASVLFALLAGNAYMRVIPSLQQQVAVAAQPSMEVVSYESLSIGPVRSGGAEQKVIAIPAGKPATLYLLGPVLLDNPVVRYDIELRKDDGTIGLTTTVRPAPEQSTITLLLRSLPAGSYVLAIHGVRADGNRTGDAVQYPLKVQQSERVQRR